MNYIFLYLQNPLNILINRLNIENLIRKCSLVDCFYQGSVIQLQIMVKLYKNNIEQSLKFNIPFPMKNGHRRTQSDDYYIAHQGQKPTFKFKLRSKLMNNEIYTILEKSSRDNKIKTTYVQSLDQQPSFQIRNNDPMFQFGKKSLLNSTRSTGTNGNTNRDISSYHLNSIPQRRQKSVHPNKRNELQYESRKFNRSQTQQKIKKSSKMVSQYQKKIIKQSPYLLKSTKNESKKQQINIVLKSAKADKKKPKPNMKMQDKPLKNLIYSKKRN